MTEKRMNLTLKTLESFVGYEHVSELRNLLQALLDIRSVIPYIHFPFTIFNLVILLLSVLLYRNPAISKPSFLFVGHLAFTDSLVTLCSSIVSTSWLSRFMWPKIEDMKANGFLLDSSPRSDVRCRLTQVVLTFIISVSLLSLLLLTIDRYINISRGLRYPVIMTTRVMTALLAGVWITATSLATIVYFTFQLPPNHVCSYTSVVPAGFQAAIVVIFHLLLMAIFGSYFRILKKFYGRKKSLERAQRLLDQDFNKIQFSATRCFIIPLHFEEAIPSSTNDETISTVMVANDNRKLELVVTHRQRRRSINRSLLFYVSYLSAARYVLIILITFTITCLPFFQFIGQDIFRIYFGYKEETKVHKCSAGRNNEKMYANVYLGDCIKFLLLSDEPSFCVVPTMTSGTHVASSHLCHRLYETSEELCSSLWAILLFLLGVCNSAVNPMLYAVWYTDFRHGAADIVLCRWRASTSFPQPPLEFIQHVNK